ncbi:unnamed protein product [Bursaphelenchus okinawaensis]|uniref:Uncharacterized protein n=1 Tax=Bursaphelenchus okinawaensis TaxID=465554 RepID=A0A811KG75_9BILA|nr:unnamed protein product [Bursaphelenchus okinawaensis]CAG9102519.1 unnamed protein product [Bursaphelenchus okinawaensis]
MPNELGHFNDSYIGSRSNILSHHQENVHPHGEYVDKTIRLKSDVKISLNDVPHSPVDQYEKYGKVLDTPNNGTPKSSPQCLSPHSNSRTSPVSRGAQGRRRSVPENALTPKSTKDLPPAGPSVYRPRRRSLFAAIKDKLHPSSSNLQAPDEQEEPISQLEKDIGYPPPNNTPPFETFIGSPHAMVVDQFRQRSKSDAVRHRGISINSQQNDLDLNDEQFSRGASTEEDCSDMDGDENDNIPMYKHEFRAPTARRSSAMYFQPPKLRSRRCSEVTDDLHSVSSSTPGRGVMVMFCKSPPNSSCFSPATQSRHNSQQDLDFERCKGDSATEFDLDESLADLSLSRELFVDTSVANHSSSSNSFNMTNDAPHTHPVNNHGSSPSNIWKRIISRKRAVSACHEQPLTENALDYFSASFNGDSENAMVSPMSVNSLNRSNGARTGPRSSLHPHNPNYLSASRNRNLMMYQQHNQRSVDSNVDLARHALLIREMTMPMSKTVEMKGL